MMTRRQLNPSTENNPGGNMFGNSDVDGKTRPRFNITTADNVNMTESELREFVRKTQALGDTHFTNIVNGVREERTVVVRATGTTPDQNAKSVLEQVLGNTSA